MQMARLFPRSKSALKPRGRSSTRRAFAEESGIFIVLVVVVAVFSVLSPNFRTVSNASVLLVNGMVIAFMALGQTFVLLTGGIDLSTGSNVAMTGVLAALLMQHGLPWPVASLPIASPDPKLLCGPTSTLPTRPPPPMMLTLIDKSPQFI